jgi:hypothetical protein
MAYELAIASFETRGICVFPSVLDSDECASMISGAWDFVESSRRAHRKLPTTWVKVFPVKITRDVQFVSDVVTNSKVVELFSALGKGRENISCSASFGVPPEVTNKGWYRSSDAFKTDPGATLCGFVTAYPIRVGDETIAFLEGSHALDIAKNARLLNHDVKYLKDIFDVGEVVCPAGSLVVWDSRLVHARRKVRRSRDKPNFHLVVNLRS